MSNFKVEPIRNDKWLAEVRLMPCTVEQDGEHCNGSPIHAHHLTTIKGERGMGQKTGDNYTLPLCSLHHNALHRIGEKSFWRLWGIDAIEETKRLWETFNNKGN